MLRLISEGPMRRTDTIYDDLKGISGIYLLRQTPTGPVHRVGQTRNVHSRMGNHWGEYKFFTFRRCQPRYLNRDECKAWHRYGGERDQLDGNHPPRPSGRCPVSGCPLDGG